MNASLFLTINLQQYCIKFPMKPIQFKNMKNHPIYFTALLSALLAGCGGSGDSNSSVNPPAPDVVQKMSLVSGMPSGSGNQDGDKNSAYYNNEYGMGGLAVAHNGDIVFSDVGNNTIRKISKDGSISTVAGGGFMLEDLQYHPSPKVNHADGKGAVARFYEPRSLVFDMAGHIYVNDKKNNIIRKIESFGNVSTLSGTLGQCDYNSGDESRRLCRMDNIAIDPVGNIYVAEEENAIGNSIKKVTPAGVVSTVTEKVSIYKTPYPSLSAVPLKKYFPVYVAVDAEGTLYAADPNDRVVKKYINGEFKVFSGTLAENNGGYADGLPTEVKFSHNITGAVFDKRNQLYVLDDKRIRRMAVDGSATTVLDLSNACSGINDQPAQNPRCRFDNLAVDDSGNFLLEEKGTYGIGYRPYSVLRQFTVDGRSSVVAGKAPTAAWADGDADTARFSNPGELAISPSGTIHVWDAGNGVIRTISEAGQTSTWGVPEKQCDLSGLVTAGETKKVEELGHCHFSQLAADKNNNIYAASQSYIFKISPNGDMNVFADLLKYSEFNGYFSSVAIQGMAIAEDGGVYASYATADVSDAQKSAIFKITPTGIASLFAGSLSAAGHRDGLAGEALFTNPKGMAFDNKGNLYVLDDSSIVPSAVTGPTLRKITPSGEVTTIAGQAAAAPGLVDGNGSEARFVFSNKKTIYNGLLNANLAVDAQNNMYITDPQHSVIRKVTPAGKVSTLVGKSGVHGFSDGDLPGIINRPVGIAVHKDVLYFSTQNAIAKINLK